MTVTDADDLPEHVRLNRASWDRAAAEYVGPGERAWATDEPAWGIFGVPEAEVGFFRTELADKDVIELGCCTGYVSAWIARRGGRPVGIDNSPRQLEAAARFQRAHGMHRITWPDDEPLSASLAVSAPEGERRCT